MSVTRAGHSQARLVCWLELTPSHGARSFHVETESMSTGLQGVPVHVLSDYLDQHIDGPFADFVDDFYAGTPFLPDLLKTVHRFYRREPMPIIRTALRFVLAYNLTTSATFVRHSSGPAAAAMRGRVRDESSRHHGKTLAPAMVGLQVKSALSQLWRGLHADVLGELSALYASVYSGNRLKHWPTIFMLAALLLSVWEEMQFDTQYLTRDDVASAQFCDAMETMPVGVILGLFHAISQKLPALADWDTTLHGRLLHDNAAVCDAMTEMRAHVTRHGTSLSSATALTSRRLPL
jgi:hypothetical protein